MQSMKLLFSLEVGQQALVGQIHAAHEKKIKLLGLGINTGSSVSILRNRGGDMVLALGNSRISVGRTLAGLIEVRAL